MATYDVRYDGVEGVTEIVFAEEYGVGLCQEEPVAYKIEQSATNDNVVLILDLHEAVILESKEHAQNLIKSLNKAIELGWVK